MGFLRQNLLQVNRHRPFLSFVAATIAILVAIEQDHVHLVVTDTGTWSDLLIHRCGMLVAAMAGWAMLELLAALEAWWFSMWRRQRALRSYPR